MTLGEAQKKWDSLGIPRGQQPEEWRYANYRPTKRARKAKECKYIPSMCLGALRMFCNNVPDPVGMFSEHQEITSKRVRIPFYCPEAFEKAKELHLTSFLMDFTFETNEAGLLLGAIGPVGVHVLEDGQVHMRFLPAIFLVSDAEDKDAQQLLTKLFFEMSGSERYTDGFFDMSCLQGAWAEVWGPHFVPQMSSTHQDQCQSGCREKCEEWWGQIIKTRDVGDDN